MAPRVPSPLASLRTSAAAGVTGMKGPSPPSAIRHHTRLAAPACSSRRSPPRSVPRKRRRSAMRGQRGSDRRQRRHQPASAPATTTPTARHGRATVPSRPGEGVADAEASREQRRFRQIARRHPAPAHSWQPHAPQAAPDMPALLVGDRPARAAHDRRHQSRPARRVVAGHDAEGNALDRAGLQRLLDHRTGEGRCGACSGADQHARFQRRIVQLSMPRTKAASSARSR